MNDSVLMNKKNCLVWTKPFTPFTPAPASAVTATVARAPTSRVRRARARAPRWASSVFPNLH